MNLTVACPACSHPRRIEGQKQQQEVHCLSCGARYALPAKSDDYPRLIAPPKEQTGESVESLLRKARARTPRASILFDTDAQGYFKQCCLVVLVAALVLYFNAPLAYPEGRPQTFAVVTAIAVLAAWKSSKVVYVGFMVLVGISCGLGYHRDVERVREYGLPDITEKTAELFRSSRANPNDMIDERGIREVRLHRNLHLAPVDDAVTLKVLFNSSKIVTGSGVTVRTENSGEPTQLFSRAGTVHQEKEPGPRSFGQHAPAGPRIRNLLRLTTNYSSLYVTVHSETMKDHLHEAIDVDARIGTRVRDFNRSPDSRRKFIVVPVTGEEFEQYRTWYALMRLRGPLVNTIVVFIATCVLCVIKSKRDKELPEYADEPDGDETQQIIATIRRQ